MRIVYPIVTFSICSLLFFSCAKSKKPEQFSAAEKALITSDSAHVSMRVLQINTPTDSLILRTPCDSVMPDSTDATLQLFIDRLYTTVNDSMHMGVGIAAPQVGILKNIIWIQRFDKPDYPFEVYLNPTIKQYTKKTQICREGCLSIPDRMDTLGMRAYAILIEYDTPKGEHKIEMVEDFTAVIFQHEIDHLNGIMYTDHLQQELEDSVKN